MYYRLALLLSTAFLAIGLAAGTTTAQISHSVGLLKGEVTLADGTPLPNVQVVIFRGVDRVTQTKSSADGKITSVLQPNGMYRFAVSEAGYMYHEDTLNVPALSAYREFPVHLVLTPLHDGERFDLAQPVFEPRSRDINPAADAELEAISYQLKHNPRLSVSVVVYPDAPVKTKKDAAQKTLAGSRATAIRSYFMGKGLTDARFSVETVTTTIPSGRFPMPANLVSHAKPSRVRGRKTSPEPDQSNLFPQYVEIMAHIEQ